MKRLVTIAAVLVALVAAELLRAADLLSVVVRWDVNDPADGVAFYNLRWSPSGSPTGYVRQVTGTASTVSLPSAGPWTFTVTAVASNGLESLPSSNLVVRFPLSPAGVRWVAGTQTVTTNWIASP